MPTPTNAAAALVAFLALTAPTFAQSLPPAFAKTIPADLHDLQDIEQLVQKLVEKVIPATVNLRIGTVQGSGVIVNREGYILTAGHVSGAANRDVLIILHDGRRLKGRTLGANNGIDSGMVRISEDADFKHAEMANSAPLAQGTWCLSLGHPGGHKPGRPPVVRLGRVQQSAANFIISDCALVGGDSGGPLFDMHGKVIGIHSRIGDQISSNIHVPIGAYNDAWTRLTHGEVWGNPAPLFTAVKAGEAYLGVRAAAEKTTLKIESVTSGSPAEKAGLKTDDLIVTIDNVRLASVDDLSMFLKTRRPGTQINVHLQRRGETMTIAVVLGKRAG
jgi:serine protease Do